MGSDQFMSLAGSFGSSSVYPQLKQWTSTRAASSIIYPSCPTQKRISVPELVSLWVQTSSYNSQVAFKHVYQLKQNAEQMSWGEFVARPVLAAHKTNIVFVHMQADMATEQDNMISLTMNHIAQQVDNKNNFVALFTSNAANEQQQLVRSALRFAQTPGTTSNGTTWSVDAPEPLYIDEHIVTGTLVGLLFLFMIYCAFYPVCTIQTAVHLTDLNVGQDEQQQQQQAQKKNK